MTGKLATGLLALALAGCGGPLPELERGSGSALQTAGDGSRLYAALVGDSDALRFSAPSPTSSLSFCWGDEATCTASGAALHATRKIGTKDGLDYFALDAALPVEARTFTIVAHGPAGVTTRTARFESRATGDWPSLTPTDPELQRRAEEATRSFQGTWIIGRDGKVLAAGGSGLANTRSGERNGVDTSLRLASVSKPLTAIAIMQLVEAGKIALSDKVRQHVPEYGSAGDRVTIEHLLTHGSGIPDYVGSVGNPSSSADLIATFKDWSLSFTPGSRYQYSNSNYALLGYIIEKVTGIPYPEYMRTRIFEPARMTHSGFEFPRTPGAGFGAPSGGNPSGPWEPNMKAYAAGALYASAGDMFFLNHALYAGILLKPESIRAMHTARNGRYGYGFIVESGRVGHDGVIPGFTSRFYSYPAVKGVVMVLSNGSQGAGAMADRLAQLARWD